MSRAQYALQLLDSSIKRRSLDGDTCGLRIHGRDVVMERGIGENAKSEGFGVLGEECFGVSGFGLDDLTAPVCTVPRRRCIEGVHFMTKMLDLEWIQNLALGVVCVGRGEM